MRPTAPTATFNEPAGITAAGDKLYVADTNNHAIRVVELAPPHRVSTLEIEGLRDNDECRTTDDDCGARSRAAADEASSWNDSTLHLARRI